MTRSMGHLGRGMRVVLIGGAALLVAASACSGEDDSPAPRAGKGGKGGTGDASAGTAGALGASGASGAVGASGIGGSSGVSGASGSGGLAGSAGLGATGGAAGSAGTGSDACPGPTAIPPETFPLCPDNVRCVPVAGGTDGGAAPDAGDASTAGQLCVSARCVPNAAIPNPEQLALLPNCPQADTKCVPDNFVATAGNFLLKSCRSLLDAEGRCIPVSLPAVRAQVDRLPQGVCESTERCAPCYDPLTGMPTGACSAGCGPGAQEPAKTYPACCNGIGACIPPALAGADASRLGKESCATGDVCAPKSFSDSTYVPPTCRSVGDTEGRCLPDCLPEIASQASLLPRSTCAEHHLCAPCYDPVKSTASTPVNTGACNRGTDTPKEQPKVFPNCCGDIGVCVPTAAVPAAQRPQLGKDSCTGTDILCAPRAFTDPANKPSKCRSLNDSEGRCLPACLPAVSSQPGLPKSTCSDGYLCAPCYNPVTSASSGACGINGDAPTEQPKPFARCCTADSGACVPTSLIPDAQESLLGKDKCTGANDLCVPTELSDPAFVPQTCDSLGGGEGRCLAPCIPAIAAQASRLKQGTCPANRLCAPCYDPTNGTATGACSIGTDSPKKPPYRFPGCCAYQGTNRGMCIPGSIVPPQGANLAQGSCPANAGDPFKCVPNIKVADINAKFATCRAQFAPFPAVDGGCVPDCMVTDPLQLAVISRQTCAEGELCAPCVNPLDNTRTGACD